MIRVSVAGASGYSGAELVRLLLGHPGAELVHVTAREQSGRTLGQTFPSLRGVVEQTLGDPDWQRLGADSDVVFLALPHGIALEAAPQLLETGARVVDLGGDYRLQRRDEYQRWYGLEHSQPALLEEAVYGLPELHRERIRSARLVANPGCYPTAAALALLPLLSELPVEASTGIVVDAKSGVSGAGRAAAVGTLFAEVNENVRPYKTGDHRHAPEIEQTLRTTGRDAKIFFSPHLIPMTRGIASAAYLRCQDPPAAFELLERLHAAWRDEPFVRVIEELPETKATLGSNYCDVSVRADPASGVVVALSALDNLVKGAAGQAIQNMNLMFGVEETTGLEGAPLYP